MLSVNSRFRDLFLQPNSVYAKPIARRFVLAAAFFALFMLILSSDFIPDKVSLQLGQVSDRDILAPRSISYVDSAKTKKLEMEVLASVANVYDLDVGVTVKTDEKIGDIFRAARSAAVDKALTAPAQRTDRIQQMLPVPLPAAALAGLANLDESGLVRCEDSVRNLLHKYYQRGVREDELEVTRKHIVIETEDLGLSKNAEAVVAGVGQTLLQPNYILNVRETDKRKQAAMASIEPVRETVKEGQVLVRRGDMVTADQIHAMEELNLYKGQVNELRFFGLALYLFTIMALMMAYLYKFARSVYANDLNLVLLGFIFVVNLLMAKAAHYYSDFVAPLASGALLAAILIDRRVGLLFSVIASMLFGVIVDHDLRAVAVAMTGSIAGVYSVSKMAHHYSLTRAGLWVAAINFVVIGSTGFMEQIDGMRILTQGMYGVISGIASAIITTGMLPYLENSFSITTPLKLLELAKPNHPLLQRLLLDAPGTYHHSVLVGNLAETAADSVGADPVTVRVGAYYHDIGKIKRPAFFIENQFGSDNPHDKIAPSLSTLIVTSHIKDGIDLCRDYKLPQPVIDIVEQHHGTTLVSYFYRRAAETEHCESLVEADFRYEGPCPQTKEAALIMLADSCEAAVRSLGKPNVNRIEATVRKIIRERLNDGQLNDCDLTLRDLTVIGDVFIRVLSSVFHTRIEYPEALGELERRKVKNGNPNKQLTDKDNCNAPNGTNG